MLHAEIHGKLNPEADDAERREDVLTSTVFGTLFVAGAWEILLAWLNRARPVKHHMPLQAQGSSDREYWFWPRLHDAEPDLIIQTGADLITIEAKYHSGKSGTRTATPDGLEAALDDNNRDQLVREWHACSLQADMTTYPDALRRAIHSRTHSLIYLVRRSRWSRELRAIADSASKVERARMYLLTWEDLDDVLATRTQVWWASELRLFLYRRGLAAFRGFSQAISSSSNLTPSYTMWTYRPARTDVLRTTFPTARLSLLQSLVSRRSRLTSNASWTNVIDPSCLNGLASLARNPTRFIEEE